MAHICFVDLTVATLEITFGAERNCESASIFG
jgi:hypothetical protein